MLQTYSENGGIKRQERTCKEYKSQDALWSIKVYSYTLVAN